MKYEEPRIEVIRLMPRDVFMTSSPVGGVVIDPPDTPGEGGEDEF